MVIFLYGENTYQSLEKLRQLRSRFQREVDPTGTSITTLEGGDLDLAHLRKVVLAPALFVKSRFVVIKQFFQINPSEELQEQLVLLLSEYGQSDTSNVIVFWDSLGSAFFEKKGSVLFSFLQQQKFSQEFTMPTMVQLRTWVMKQVEALDTTIERDALTRFLQVVGIDMWRVASELEKLIAYASGRSITVTDIETLVSHTEDIDVYSLLDAIVAGNTSQALERLQQLLAQQVDEYSIVTIIKWHVQAVAAIAAAYAGGVTADMQIAKLTGLHQYVVRKNKTYATSLSLESIERMYQESIDLELGLRTQIAPARILFSQFIFSTTA